MHSSSDVLALLREIEWPQVLLIAVVLAGARALSAGLTWLFVGLERRAPSRWRMTLMRFMPLTRFLVAVGAVILIIPLVIQPSASAVLTLLASVGLALAFTLKDYASSVVAALVTVFEHPYQPGDWIAVDKTYGEVKAIGLRAVRVLTPDDTEVLIPHSKLWSTSLFNATSGNRHVLCVADFYLNPSHDGGLVRQTLLEVASASPYLQPESKVTVIVVEKPWGTHYKLKAYAKDSRDQFEFVTDLTLRAKEALQRIGAVPARAPFAVAP